MNHKDEKKVKRVLEKFDGICSECQVDETRALICSFPPSGRFFKDPGDGKIYQACIYHLRAYLDSNWLEVKR